MKTAFATPSGCPEQVTQDSSFNLLAFPTGNFEEPQLRKAEGALVVQGLREVTKPAKKRVSKFDERSHYVIENKGTEKRTKPNEANLWRWILRKNPARPGGNFWPPKGKAADFRSRPDALRATTPSPPAPLPQRGEGRVSSPRGADIAS